MARSTLPGPGSVPDPGVACDGASVPDPIGEMRIDQIGERHTGVPGPPASRSSIRAVSRA